ALYRQVIISILQAPLRLSAQMAACFGQINTITVLLFYLFVLIINRMLTLLVFNKVEGIGSASNKRLWCQFPR
ncbi:hypothetical protein, partial [Alteromonas stellipolaris]|uniref:hypothetical protein n=1 Tax=Alteromonas stellipolaris TaxID=233316 RepID=UPI003CD0D6E6